ncbi:unnamed protein product [Symbiodinium microadriaticum]|nr:unnamed protein product [Symbiodinium microadriaticum]
MLLTHLVLAQDVKIELGPDQVASNQLWRMTITVENERLRDYSPFPEIQGMAKRGTSSSTSTSFVNGRMTSSQSITQNYLPLQEGTVVIPNFDITINGRDYRIQGKAVTIGPPVQQQQRNSPDPFDPFQDIFNRDEQSTEYIDVEADAFLALTTDKSEVYVGEGFTTTLAFYVSESNQADMRFFDLGTQITEIVKEIKPESCWEENFNIDNVTGVPVKINGKGYTQYKIFQAAYYPLNRDPIDFPAVGLKLIKYKRARPSHADYTYQELDLRNIDSNDVRCPDPEMAQKMFDYIDETRKKQDTIGGIITGVIKNVPVGLGEPVFDKLHAELGKAMLSINAVKGFEYGSGFGGVRLYGSEHNDEFYEKDGRIRTRSNHSGGIQGGISNGEDIYFNVAFKPVATIMKDQQTVNQEGASTTISAYFNPMRRLPLHTKILIGMTLGLIFGMVCIQFPALSGFTIDFIKPIGTIFIRALKMVAVPLVLASLIIGVANIGDISKLSRMGGKTLLIFIVTTIVSITIGLSIVAIMKPGDKITEETRISLMESFGSDAEGKIVYAEEVKERGPLQPLVDMVPDNIFLATTNNSSMLQVVFFALLIGVALLKIPKKNGETVLNFFNGINDLIVKIVEFIMLIAPYGVFALIASLLVEIAGDNPDQAWELLYALLWYAITVIAGMMLMMVLVYPLLIRYFSKIKYFDFFKGMRPAMLLGFSTSSSTATLPVTMDRVENHLGVSEEVSSFVLPLGATINMNGTSLYQGVSAVFIAQALGMDMTLTTQLTIVLTATLAAVGTAGVPGAGLVMLIIVLEAAGIPAAGIALIMAPERILDMIRTMVNVTGDASVSVVVASTENALDENVLKEHVDD